jgi:hypothetical protein
VSRFIGDAKIYGIENKAVRLLSDKGEKKYLPAEVERFV